jgi:hypothetical protein
MLPGASEGYKLLPEPPGYEPIRTPARKLMATPTPFGGTPMYQIPEEDRQAASLGCLLWGGCLLCLRRLLCLLTVQRRTGNKRALGACLPAWGAALAGSLLRCPGPGVPRRGCLYLAAAHAAH